MEKFTTLARRLLPTSVQNSFLPLYRGMRSKLKAAKRGRMKKFSLEHLKSDLGSAGICQGDTIMVHSSLSRIGNVDGGAETVIKSLIGTVTPGGTIMMPCYGSAEDVQQGMKEGRFVDLRTSKSVTGKITEVFRTWPEVVRSSHPFSSVCAWGAQAEYITSRHATNPYVCHAESPVGRTVELNVKVVGIGVTIAVGMAAGHYLEDTYDAFPFEVHSLPFQVKYIDSAGNAVTREVVRYDPLISARRIDHVGGEWIREMLTKHFTRVGILRWFRFGNADSWVMEAQPLCAELKRLAQKGITMYLARDEWKSMNAGDESIGSW